MILNYRNKRPIITFGLGKVEETISLGETVRIWQGEIYNGDNYKLRYAGTDKPIYGFELTPVSTGVLNIQCHILSLDGKVNILSNIIKLTVI
jgi:hypothetical protein